MQNPISPDSDIGDGHVGFHVDSLADADRTAIGLRVIDRFLKSLKGSSPTWATTSGDVSSNNTLASSDDCGSMASESKDAARMMQTNNIAASAAALLSMLIPSPPVDGERHPDVLPLPI